MVVKLVLAVCLVLCALWAEGQAQCTVNGVTYQDGESYSPDPCTYCTCTSNTARPMCAIMDCAYPMCMDGSQPVRVNGQCCPTCQRGAALVADESDP